MLIQSSVRVIAVLMGIMSLTGAWAVPCPIPSSQIRAEWFQISSDKKEAHANVRDNNFKVWTMNIFSKKYLLNELITVISGA